MNQYTHSNHRAEREKEGIVKQFEINIKQQDTICKWDVLIQLFQEFMPSDWLNAVEDVTRLKVPITSTSFTTLLILCTCL